MPSKTELHADPITKEHEKIILASAKLKLIASKESIKMKTIQ